MLEATVDERVYIYHVGSHRSFQGKDWRLYDAEGKHIAAVRRNEIYFGEKEAYKIDGSANRYLFSERASNKVICDIRKREDAHPAELEVAVLQLYTPAGKVFEVTPDRTNLPGNNMFYGAMIVGSQIGIQID